MQGYLLPTPVTGRGWQARRKRREKGITINAVVSTITLGGELTKCRTDVQVMGVAGRGERGNLNRNRLPSSDTTATLTVVLST